MANTCEPAQGSLRCNEPKGLIGSNQKVRWQETRSNGRVSRSSSTRSTSWCLRSRTPKAELGNPVCSPRAEKTRSFLPDRRGWREGQDRSGRRESRSSLPPRRPESFRRSDSNLGKSTARATHGHAGQDAGRSECRPVVGRIQVRNLPGAKASRRPAGVSLQDRLENRLEGESRKKARIRSELARPHSPESGDLSAANQNCKGCSRSANVEIVIKSNRVDLSSAFERLEPGAVKVARRVLRGAGAGNGPVPTRLRQRIAIP